MATFLLLRSQTFLSKTRYISIQALHQARLTLSGTAAVGNRIAVIKEGAQYGVPRFYVENFALVFDSSHGAPLFLF